MDTINTATATLRGVKVAAPVRYAITAPAIAQILIMPMSLCLGAGGGC